MIDRLGSGQVDFPVQKGPFREFTRFGEADTPAAQGLDDLLHDNRITMAEYLSHVLPRITSRCGVHNHDNIVNQRAVFGEGPIAGVAGLRFSRAVVQRGGGPDGFRAADSDNGD